MRDPQRGAILLVTGFLLTLVGIAPLGFLLWRGSSHNWEPLSVYISLKQGQYKSPFFTTDENDEYEIEIYFLPPHQIPLDLDWNIVDRGGTTIQSGTYRENDQMGGNDVILTRSYRPKRGSPHRIILNIHHDVPVGDADTRLHVGLPEKGLEQAYGSAAAIRWAAFVFTSGVIVLVVLLILGFVRPKIAGGTS